MEIPDPEKNEIAHLGFLVIKKRPNEPPVAPEMIRALQDEIDEEDLQRALHPGAP
jgi:hypothetical protein